MQKFKKTFDRLSHACVRVATMGLCSDLYSLQENTDDTTSRIEMSCGPDRGLQSIFGEIDAAGLWTRFSDLA